MRVAFFQREADANPMRAMGLVGAAVQLILAAVLGGVAIGASDFPNPPEAVPRGLAIGLPYAVPALIGTLGAIGGRRLVLGAAAFASTVGSVLAFSGVTLIFLVPALLFAGAASGTGSAPLTPSRPFWRFALFTALAVLVVVLAVLRLGIFVIPAIVLLVLILEAARGAARASLGNRLAGVGLAVVIGGLVIGSGVALFAMTETRCWVAYQTPSGIAYGTVAEAQGGEIRLGQDEIAGGCDSGELTPRGATLAALLAVGATSVAALASRSRPALGLVAR
jgi:hypothetical protein